MEIGHEVEVMTVGRMRDGVSPVLSRRLAVMSDGTPEQRARYMVELRQHEVGADHGGGRHWQGAPIPGQTVSFGRRARDDAPDGSFLERIKKLQAKSTASPSAKEAVGSDEDLIKS